MTRLLSVSTLLSVFFLLFKQARKSLLKPREKLNMYPKQLLLSSI